MVQTLRAVITGGPAGREGDSGAPRRARAAADWTVLAPAVLTFAIMLWDITASSYTGDEADTVSADSRTLPQLIRLLGHVDVVHGLYYVVLWPVVQLLGPGELATRLPSAAAMAVAAWGIAVTGRRLASRSAGLLAGLVFAALPVISEQGHNARPYAMVTAAAVAASYLLVRVAGEPRRRWLVGYGVALVALGYLELFALLLVLAHAVALRGLTRGQRQPVTRRWLAAVGAATVAVVPLAAAGWLQRGQIAWIRRPGWGDVRVMLASLAGGPVPLAATLWAAAVLGCALALHVRHGRPGTAGRKLAVLALPWLVLPPVVLLAASLVQPVYNFRYIVFCTPALALLAGLGLAALERSALAAALVLILALSVPAQLGLRAPGPGSGMREAAMFLSTHEQPGDAIVYPGTGIPPWYLAYPAGFGRLDDIGLARSPAEAGRLYGVSVPLPVLKSRERHVRRIWVVQMGTLQSAPPSPASYLATGLRLVHAWRLDDGSLRIWLYRSGPTLRTASSRHARR